MTEAQIKTALSTYVGWFGLNAQEQKALFGYALLGRVKCLLAKEDGLYVSYSTGYGQDRHHEHWSYTALAELTEERKKIHRRVN